MSQPRIKKPAVLVVNPGDNATPPAEHNYIKKLLAMKQAGLLSSEAGAASVRISHDDWCDIFTGGACNCEPLIRVEQPKA